MIKKIFYYIYTYIHNIIYNKKINGDIIFCYNTPEYTECDKLKPSRKKILCDKFIKLYNKNKKFTYIEHANIKYRFLVSLNDDTEIINLQNTLLKIPIHNNINIFGKNHYLHSVYDIRYITSHNRYFYKTDLTQAYATLNIDILFKILNRHLNIFDYTYIKQILYGYYKLDNYVVNLNMLYQGLGISPILFSIYINEIITDYINKVSDNNIYTYSDDILLFSNDYNKLRKQVQVFKAIIKSHNLKLNYKKTTYIDIENDSLIFLNRIIISHYNDIEIPLLQQYENKKNKPAYLMFFNFEKFIEKTIKKTKQCHKTIRKNNIDNICASYNGYIKYIMYIYETYKLKNTNKFIYTNYIINTNMILDKFIDNLKHDFKKTYYISENIS